MKIYHKDIFFPETTLKTVIGRKMMLNYSSHAQRECLNDKYGIVKPIMGIFLTKTNLIELYVNDWNQVFKVLARTPQEDELDSCLIINLGESLVITNWLCKREDTHLTLDKNKYSLI